MYQCEMVMWSPSQTGGFPPTRRPAEWKHRCQRAWLKKYWCTHYFHKKCAMAQYRKPQEMFSVQWTSNERGFNRTKGKNTIVIT